MNRRRSTMTDSQAEDLVIQYCLVLSFLFIVITTLLLTLAKVACAPAAHLVPADHPSIPPYNLAQSEASQRQAGELARFYRENF